MCLDNRRSSGIGRHWPRNWPGGLEVAISARSKAALAEIAATHDNITGFEGDVVDRPGMAKMVTDIEKALGPIALGVMNAGIYLPTNMPILTRACLTGHLM